MNALLDPCFRRTASGLPCDRSAHHRGACTTDLDAIEMYHAYARHLRERAQTMTGVELQRAAEFHRLAWKVLHDEYNAR